MPTTEMILQLLQDMREDGKEARENLKEVRDKVDKLNIVFASLDERLKNGAKTFAGIKVQLDNKADKRELKAYILGACFILAGFAWVVEMIWK